MRRVCSWLILMAFGGSHISVPCHAQGERPDTSSKDRFPLAFENFVWWSDADLRAELKKRVPALGQEIERGSPLESRVRIALTQLLKEKGVQAEVLALEPSKDVASGKRVPEAPPLSIVYSVLGPPDILVEKLSFENAPSDGSAPLNEVATSMTGRPYQETAFWSSRQRIREALQGLGYLSSSVTLDHGTPRRNGEQYLVPLKASIMPGPKFHVSSVKADGGPLVQGRDLSPYFALKPGDVATPYAFGKLAGALRSVYWHAGYADVDFTGPPILDEVHALAAYQLQVTPGPLYRLRSVKFENLDLVQETKAREMLGLKAGDVYDLMAVSSLNGKLSAPGSPLRGYGFSYTPKEDKQNLLVDLILKFYRQ